MSGVIVCRERTREVSRVVDGDPRWCFRHRGISPFEKVVTAPVDPHSYYGPNVSIECTVCKAPNGDLGFGRWREWD